VRDKIGVISSQHIVEVLQTRAELQI